MNKAAEQWFRDLREVGCICCRLYHNTYSPPDIHHLIDGGRRMGDLYTIPLCPNHHRSGRNDAEVVSRDQNRSRFEKRYGKELWLLDRTRELVMQLRERTYGRAA